jgi:isocitrate/isopropylmalate dehydrogenase
MPPLTPFALLADLYANIVPIKSLPGITTRHSGIDMVVFRENTEAEYSGFEQEVTSGVVQSLKVVTRYASRLASISSRRRPSSSSV